MGLDNYDVVISDIDEKVLRNEVSRLFGIDYLVKATEDDAKRDIDAVNGYLYGQARRSIVPFVVRNGGESYWVHFIVDIGAPVSFLSEKACDVLNIRTDATTLATIAGYRHPVRMSPKKSHITDLNILGADFCDNNKFTTWFRGHGKVTYFFEDRWSGAKELGKRGS